MSEMHIYSQEFWHSPAMIMASRDSLVDLRNAIEQALINDQTKVEFFCSDGEGYVLWIKVATDDEMNQVMLPYNFYGSDEITPSSLPSPFTFLE